MNTRSWFALLVLVPLALLASCGGDDVGDPADGSGSSSTQPAGDETPADDPLAGRTFVTDRLVADGAEVVVPGDGGVELNLTFGEDGELSARAACNTLSTDYVIDGDALRTSEVGSTEIGCNPERHDFDALVGRLLESPRFALDDDDLSLTSADGSVSASLRDVEVVDPSPPVEGTVWTLDTFIDGESASSVPAGVGPITMTLTDGRLSVDTGCNGVGGEYELAEGSISIVPGVSTKRFCGDEIAEAERRLRNVLRDEVAVEQERSSMTLTRDGTGLVFAAGG